MKTSIETLANLLSVVVWAGGEYDETAKETVGEIAEAFGIDKAALTSAVDAGVEKVGSFDEDKSDEFVEAAAKGVAKKETQMVFEALLELALADGSLARTEVENIHEIGAALGLSAVDVTLFLADMIVDENAFKIEI